MFYYSTSLSEVQITLKTSTNISRYLYFRRPVWLILIYKRCTWQKIHRFPKKIRQRSQTVYLNIKNRASRVNFPWSTIKCRHLLYIDRTYKLYKLKIQHWGRWKQTLSCVIEMVLAKNRERNNVHWIQFPPINEQSSPMVLLNCEETRQDRL